MPLLNRLTVGRFIREILIGISPISILLEEWGLSHDDYSELKRTPAFKLELAAAVAELQAQGPDAGYILRCKLLSEEFLGDIETIVRDNNAPHSVKADLIRFTAELARLKPEKRTDATPAGTSVTFNFGGGIGKLLGADTIDVTPTSTLPQSEKT